MVNEYILASPIIIISILAVFGIVLDALSGKSRHNFVYSLLSLTVVAAAGIYTMTIPSEYILLLDAEEMITKNMITFGGVAAYFDILFCVAAIMTIFAAKPYITRNYKELNEFYSLILFAVSGMMLIAHANNFLIFFIGIEIMSITFYVLAGYFRNSNFSLEAALKYFLLGSFATGFLLFGIALIYGSTGTMVLSDMLYNIKQTSFVPEYLSVGLGLLVIGLSFKVAAFPFHQWAPDVYQGSPTVVTGFMSTAGKAAALIGFIIIAKSLIDTENTNTDINMASDTVQLIVALISAATMIIGNITALVQKNIKRMLSYSSVAHAGYLLMGIAANNQDGWTGIVFYATAYMFMQIGAFAIVAIIEKENEGNLQISDYAGLSKKFPLLSGLMAVFMLSLAGIPPFAGFFGKYYLFISVVEADFLWLTIVAVISSIISMYFYIGVIIQMYFKESDGKEITAQPGLANVTLVIALIGTVVFGVLPSLIVNLTANFF